VWAPLRACFPSSAESDAADAELDVYFSDPVGKTTAFQRAFGFDAQIGQVMLRCTQGKPAEQPVDYASYVNLRLRRPGRSTHPFGPHCFA
jgi:hypothetical protein